MSRTEIAAGPIGDVDTEEFRAAAHRAVEWIGDYLETIRERPVLSQVRPGDIRFWTTHEFNPDYPAHGQRNFWLNSKPQILDDLGGKLACPDCDRVA